MNQAQNMQDTYVFQRDAVVAAAKALNYWGKRLDTSKQTVLLKIRDELECIGNFLDVFSIEEIQNILNKTCIPVAGNSVKQAGAHSEEKPADTRPVTSGNLSHTEKGRVHLAGKKFLVTSAQNNTPVHASFFYNLEAYASYLAAEILVFPFLYNKNGFQNGEAQEGQYYDPAISKYLQDESIWLGSTKKVAALAFNILPTVKNPLGGMRDAIGTAQALVVPHATIAHECIPVLGAQTGAVVPAMYSTGTVTLRNYIQQQAGHKAESRHCFGALIVEFDNDGEFWIRQIQTDESGNFQDLRNCVDNGCVTDGDIMAINYGDIHAEKLDKNVAEEQWGEGNSILDYLKPQFQFCHDTLDFSSLNHHNRENHFHMARNNANGNTVVRDLQQVSDVLEQMYRPWCKTVIVRSNHDDALDRWLGDNKYEPRKDPANALFYYQLQVAAYSAIGINDEFDSFPEAMRIANLPRGDALFLHASESFKLAGVEFGEHGHSGINGSRGSPKQFSGSACNTGHTHTSSIYGKCYTAGVSGKLAMGYNEEGASSWVHACIVTYNNGMRAIVHVKKTGGGYKTWA